MQRGIQSANKDKNKDSNDATSADAIRIRDNQRRSRARRKEYQQDLERRVQKFEQQGVQATIEVQAAARKVARENTLLRSLLKLKGVATAEIDEYIANANGGDYGADVTGNGNAKANVNGNLNLHNDRLRAGIGFAQLQPATSSNSTTGSLSVPLPTPTATAFPNTMNQNQNGGQKGNRPSIELDSYPSYYPAGRATIHPALQYAESPSGQNIPGSVSASASASASISTSTSSIYSPSASFTSASLSPPTNNDQQCQPQHSSYPAYATSIPYAASRYPQDPPQQQDHQQQQQKQQHQQQSLQLPLQLHPP
ncbi:hypothetical protein ACJ73_10027, partial [Blastomyces percursus]